MATTVDPKAEHDRLRGLIQVAGKDKRDIEAELADVRVQAKALRRKGNGLQQRHEESSRAITSAMIEYTKLECRMLCEKVYDTFPRELRDIIYGYIHVEKKLSVNASLAPMWHDEVRPDVAFKDSISECHWRTGRRVDEQAHLWSAGFLGDRVLPELLEWYYRATTFTFGENWSFIPEFRSTDQWKLGHVPADFVTNVEVILDCNDYEFIEMKPEPEDGWSYAVWNKPNNASGWGITYENAHRASVEDSRRKLLTSLESLFGFKPGTKIVVQVTMSSCHSRYEKRTHMPNVVIPVILPSLLRLQTAGYKVAIILSPLEDMHDFTFALGTMVFDLVSFEQEYVRLEALQVQRQKDAKERLEAERLSEAIEEGEENDEDDISFLFGGILGFGDEDEDDE